MNRVRRCHEEVSSCGAGGRRCCGSLRPAREEERRWPTLTCCWEEGKSSGSRSEEDEEEEEEGGQPWLQVGSWLAAGGERRRKVWLDIMIEILVSIS